MRLLVCFIILTSTCFAAQLPPRWRFEYNYGQATTQYIESQPSILFTERDIEQRADFHQFIYQYYLVPPWVDFSIGGNITGITVQTPEATEQQFQYFTVFANLGFVIPVSDFWNIKLITEYFYTSTIVEDDAFGFRNLRGTQIYPEVEWLPFGSDMFFQLSPYLKVPLISDVGNRQETTVGLKFVIPVGSERNLRFPVYAYGSSLILRIFYTNMRLEYEREGFITSEIDVRQYGATLGFNF